VLLRSWIRTAGLADRAGWVRPGRIIVIPRAFNLGDRRTTQRRLARVSALETPAEDGCVGRLEMSCGCGALSSPRGGRSAAHHMAGIAGALLLLGLPDQVADEPADRDRQAAFQQPFRQILARPVMLTVLVLRHREPHSFHRVRCISHPLPWWPVLALWFQAASLACSLAEADLPIHLRASRGGRVTYAVGNSAHSCSLDGGWTLASEGPGITRG